MRPWQHAKSSAKRRGADWREHLPIHEFIDCTKASFADIRHRIVLHHTDLGTQIARMAFPDRADISEIVTQHVFEDLGFEASLADWFSNCDVSRIPHPLGRRLATGKSGVVEMVMQRADPVCYDAACKVADFLFLPADYLPAEPELALAVLMNAAGPALARRIFGPPHELETNGRSVMVDYAWLAEAIIFTSYGQIPDLANLASTLPNRIIEKA